MKRENGKQRGRNGHAEREQRAGTGPVSCGAAEGARDGSARLTKQQIQDVARLLIDEAALEPALLDGPAFESLVGERVRVVAGGCADRYVDVLRASPDEAERLILGIAVPETWLFRYPSSFELLADRLGAIARSRAGDDTPVTRGPHGRHDAPAGPATSATPPLRLLSIGCANGAEAWSIAATCAHANLGPDDVVVLAVDRSRNILDLAARGELPANALRADAPAWGCGFFERRGASIIVDRALRAMVRFEHADARLVAAQLAPRSCAAIFFRNVLIYLGPAARRPLLESLAAALTDDGVLFLGHADHVAELPAQLRPARVPHAFAFERRANHGEATTAAGTAHPQAGVAPRPTRATVARTTASGPLAPMSLRSTSVTPRPDIPAPNASPASLDEARRLADAGRLDDAEAFAGAIMERTGPTAEVAELRGLIASARDDADAAQRWFEQAVYLQPDRATSLTQLALLCERRGEVRRAAALLRRAAQVTRRAGEGGGD